MTDTINIVIGVLGLAIAAVMLGLTIRDKEKKANITQTQTTSSNSTAIQSGGNTTLTNNPTEKPKAIEVDHE